MLLSAADSFVIFASQMLIPLSQQTRDFNSVCSLLKQVHQAFQNSC